MTSTDNGHPSSKTGFSKGCTLALSMRWPRSGKLRTLVFIPAVIAVMLLAAATVGCSANESESNTIKQQLEQTAEAAGKPPAWTIKMKLAQQLEEGGKVTKLDMTTTGPVEREPLRMKQTIETAFESENSKLETYLVPDGYYMHDLTTDDWMRMAEEVVPQVKETLSDYQIRPSEPVSRLALAADKLKREQNAEGHDEYVYSGDGKDEGARAIIDDVLRGTFGGGAMTKEVAASIQVQQFDYRLAVDPATKLPSDARLKMAISVEFTPGERSTLNETLDIAYSGWNDKTSIEVPEAAKKAESITPPAQ